MDAKAIESYKDKLKWLFTQLKVIIYPFELILSSIWSFMCWVFENPYRCLMLFTLVIFFIGFYYFRKLYAYSPFLKKYSSYTSYFFVMLGVYLTIGVFGLFSSDKGEIKFEDKPFGYPNKGMLNKFYWSLKNAVCYYIGADKIFLILAVALLILWLLNRYRFLSSVISKTVMVGSVITFAVLLYRLYGIVKPQEGGAMPRPPLPLLPPPPQTGSAFDRLPHVAQEAINAATRAKRAFTTAATNAVSANAAATRALADAAESTTSRDATVIERRRMREAAKNATAAAATANEASAAAGVNYVAAAKEAADTTADIVSTANDMATTAVEAATAANDVATTATANYTALRRIADNATVADRPAALDTANIAKGHASQAASEATEAANRSTVAATVVVNANAFAVHASDTATDATNDATDAADVNDAAAAANKKDPVWFRVAMFLYNMLKSFYNTVKLIKAPNTYIKILLSIEILGVLLYLIIPIIRKYIYTNVVTKKVGILDTQANMGIDMAIIENERELSSLKGGLSLEWDDVLSAGLYKKSKEGELTKYLEKQGFLPKQGKQNTLISKLVGIPINLETAITYIQTNAPLIIELKNKIAHQKSNKDDTNEKKKKKNNIVKTKILLDKPIYTDSKKTIATYEDIGNSVGTFNYNYSISAWFFIHNQSPNVRVANTKFTSLLNYGGRPNLLFNVEKNTLKITIKNSLDKEQTIFETDKIRLQRWNNIITNVNGGKLDIFINGKLVSSTTNPVPFMSYDIISTGEDEGISGGVCNVTYFPTPLSLPEIKLLYKNLKWKNPPIIDNFF